MSKTETGIKIVAQNKHVHHDFYLEDRFEAGLVLLGTEIKSIRAGKAQLREAYISVDKRRAFLLNAHISPYDPAARQNHDPLRPRQLLLHKKELGKLQEKVQQKGYTVVPVKMYLSKGRAKLEIALAKGKKQHDKRQAIAARDSQRDIERALRGRE